MKEISSDPFAIFALNEHQEELLKSFGKMVYDMDESFIAHTNSINKLYPVIPEYLSLVLLLYRKIIDKMDAIYVCIDYAKEDVSISINRDLLENVGLFLYMIKDNVIDKAYAFYYDYLLNQREAYKMFLTHGNRTEKLREFLGVGNDSEFSKETLEKIIKNLDISLNRDVLKATKVKWESLEKSLNNPKHHNRKKIYIKWYNLFGKRSFKDVINDLKMEPLYDLVYTLGSQEVHSQNIFTQLETSDGKANFRPLRSYNHPEVSLYYPIRMGKIASDSFENFILSFENRK